MKIKMGTEMGERVRDGDIDDSGFVVVSKTFVAALRSNAELCSRGIPTGYAHFPCLSPFLLNCLLLLHYLNVH